MKIRIQVSKNPNWKEKYISHPLTHEDQLKFKRDNAFLLPFQLEFAKIFPQGFTESREDDTNSASVDSSEINPTFATFFDSKSWSQTSVERKKDEKEDIDSNETILFFSQDAFMKLTPYIIPDVLAFMLHEPLCIWVNNP